MLISKSKTLLSIVFEKTRKVLTAESSPKVKSITKNNSDQNLAKGNVEIASGYT